MSTRLEDAARELVKHGLVYAPRRDDGLRASPHWAPWLTLEAHRADMLDRIVAGHDHAHPRLSYYDDEARTAMALRCNIVAGRLARVHGGAGRAGGVGIPGRARRRRPAPHAARAVPGPRTRGLPDARHRCRGAARAHHRRLPRTGVGSVGVRRGDRIHPDSSGPPRRGGRGLRRPAPEGARGQARKDRPTPAPAALAAMLRGDDAQARLHIESAIAEERAGTRKRNVFPASAAFALSLLSLARDDSPSSRALLAPLLRTAAQRKEQPLVMHYVTRAAEARKGARIAAMTFPYPAFSRIRRSDDAAGAGVLLAGTARAVHRTGPGSGAGRLYGPRTGQRLRLGVGGVSHGLRPARPADEGRTPPVRGGVPRGGRHDARARSAPGR